MPNAHQSLQAPDRHLLDISWTSELMYLTT